MFMAVFLCITAFLMPSIDVMASNTLYEHYNTGNDSNVSVYANAPKGQTFTVTTTHNIISVKLFLYRVGSWTGYYSSSGTVNLFLYATSSGLPTGSVLRSSSILASTVTTSSSGAWYEFAISSLQLTSGTKYAILLSTNDSTGGSSSQCVMWKCDVTSPSYTGGNYIYSNDGGVNWSANTSYDFMFEEYALGIPDTPTNVSATDGTYTDKVVVTWTKSSGATGYKIYRDGELLATVGDVATYNDSTAAAGSITAGTASASDGTSSSYVTLSVSGESTSNGTTYSYTVKATNSAGDSSASTADNGYRGVGTITYQWQRSAADSDASYSNITNATTDPYNDTAGVEYPSGRYYRCVLSATGASSVTTTADRGYTVAARYWVGGTGNWSDDDNHWALTSGGSPADGNLPTQYTNVFFDANSDSGGAWTVTVNATAYCNNMDWTGAENNPILTFSNTSINIYGNVTLISAMSSTYGNGTYYMMPSGTVYWDTKGIALNNNVTLWASGICILNSDLNASGRNIYITQGTLNTNGYIVTCADFTMSNAGGNPTLSLGSSTLNCSTFIGLGIISSNTATINCSGNFTGGGLTYNVVNLTGATSTISGSNTFAELNLTSGITQTIIFESGTTQTITDYAELSGSSGHIHTLTGTATWYLIFSGDGYLELDYLAITYSSATPATSTWFAGTHSTDNGHNTGWMFTDFPDAATVETNNCVGFGYTWIIFKGTITDDGGGNITEIGFDYGLTTSYGSEVTSTGIWNTGDVIILQADDLKAGTVYHFRFKAYNGIWSYGNDMYVSTEGSPIVYEYIESGDDADSTKIYGNTYAYEYFTVGATSHSISYIQLYLYRVGSPGTVTMEIRYGTGGTPTGDIIATAILDGDNFSTSKAWYIFDLSNYDVYLQEGATYTIVLYASSGDISNYIIWRTDSGGDGDSTDYGGYSSNGGSSWTSSSPLDFLYKIWGYSCISIDNAVVLQDYIETGDMLFCVEYLNVYVPYYDSYDPSRYFYIQLYDTDGITLLAQTTCPAWQLKIASIYLSANSAASLQFGSAYYLAIYGDITGSPIAMYQLTTGDWIGASETAFKNWVFITAKDMQDYYSTALITAVASRGNVLNDTGAAIYIAGIPYIQTAFPDFFLNAKITITTSTSTLNTAFDSSATWEDMVGTKLSTAFDSVGDLVNISGSAMFGFAVFVLFLVCVMIASSGQNKGLAAGAMAFCSIILIGGTYLRVISIIPMVVILAVLLFITIKGFFMDRS
jgi:hypothetical protein